MHHLAVDLVDLDGHNLLQLLDALLHLNGLGGLIAETINEGLDVGDLFLLVLVSAELLLATLVAQHHILVILHLVVLNVATGYLERAVGYVVDERAVVANEHHRTIVLRKEGFQPAYALNVEVVGGLVEEQHVGMAQQNLGQLDTHAPTARKLAGGAVKVGALKA